MKQPKRILIMGLPGSGKTYFAERLKQYLESYMNPVNEHSLRPLADAKVTVAWLNADEVRRYYNDWDFSREGRIRQSHRMRELAEEANTDYCIVDFVAPLPEMRHNFRADWTIWIDTIDQGRFEDTNKMFVPPEVYDFRITEQNAEKWAEFVGEHIAENRRRPVFDWQAETVQMLGRWQPWHAGHRALFERLIARTGQVVIQVRDVQGWQSSNPFAIDQVKRFIKRDLDPLFQGQYEIQVVPNIVHIGWGRGVGYTSGEETFEESITEISATKIRKELGLK
jgi:broad-specificity NMP kinase